MVDATGLGKHLLGRGDQVGPALDVGAGRRSAEGEHPGAVLLGQPADVGADAVAAAEDHDRAAGEGSAVVVLGDASGGSVWASWNSLSAR